MYGRLAKFSLTENDHKLPITTMSRERIKFDVKFKVYLSNGQFAIVDKIKQGIHIVSPQGDLIRKIAEHEKVPNSLIFLSNGFLAALYYEHSILLGASNHIHIYDPLTGQQVRTFPGHPGRYSANRHSMTAFEDGRIVVSENSNRDICIYNGEGELLDQFSIDDGYDVRGTIAISALPNNHLAVCAHVSMGSAIIFYNLTEHRVSKRIPDSRFSSGLPYYMMSILEDSSLAIAEKDKVDIYDSTSYKLISNFKANGIKFTTPSQLKVFCQYKAQTIFLVTTLVITKGLQDKNSFIQRLPIDLWITILCNFLRDLLPAVKAEKIVNERFHFLQKEEPVSSIMSNLISESALWKRLEDKYVEKYRDKNLKLQFEYDKRHGLVLYQGRTSVHLTKS